MRLTGLTAFLAFVAVSVLAAAAWCASAANPETSVASSSPNTAPSSDVHSLDSLRAEIAELRRKVEKPPKDAWDKVTAVSGLASGLLVALIGFYATNVYNRRQRLSDENRKDRELLISQIQTVEKFIPHLSSREESIKRAALVSISALGNEELAIKLATAFGGPGAVDALTSIAAIAGPQEAASAQRAIQDRQRQIAASISNVAEQLGSDKLEVRLSGIYSLEQIAKESPSDYRTFIDILAAFVRKRSIQHSQSDEPPATDIAAALMVINRRSAVGGQYVVVDLRGAILRQADLRSARLEMADLSDARLEGANLREAHLERANLRDARLGMASLVDAHLEAAMLSGASLYGANLRGANLEMANLQYAQLSNAHLGRANLESANLRGASLDGANLRDARLEDAYLEGAYLQDANLEGADLKGANLEGTNLEASVGLGDALGDASTRLPAGLARPPHWPGTDYALQKS